MNLTKDHPKATANRQHSISKNLPRVLALGSIIFITSCSCIRQPLSEPEINPMAPNQSFYPSPEGAANTLVLALTNHDEILLNNIFGKNHHTVLPLDELSTQDVDNFLDGWKQFHTLLPQAKNKMLLSVGEQHWVFPIPLVEGSSGWYFDIKEGLERMRIRRIGKNELAAIQVVLAYYDAQMEYAEQDRNEDGMLEYAQKFISPPGTYDGLYWQAAPGSSPSPLGTLLADRTEDGGYHGYYYRILKAQGQDAPGGAYNYLIDMRMRAGFALVAWPIKYGEDGVMSFMISHEGIVYEQNLGPNGATLIDTTLLYNPDKNWIATQETINP